ncbi:MAG TPA: hypothetical protein VN791_07560 [Acidimicrobiales bacterium]|nr:hypothetical protein [Acidimicrobiales bacterium]
MAVVELWCRVTVVGPDGAEVGCWVLTGPGMPDLGAVDDVARLALLARRLGGAVVLTELSPALRTLLELTGLRIEVEGQAELGKETLGVQEGQEEGHPGDPPL